jgi:glycosyltransferase involved in cell wall biosynthesis
MAKVALFCLDVVGKSMAGPAIRYYEFAKALARHHEVILITPNACDLEETSFTIVQRSFSTYLKVIPTCDVVITQRVTAKLAFFCRLARVRLILDAYDPMPLENLEIFKDLPIWIRRQRNTKIIEQFRFSFRVADGIICANEHQRSLWMGLSIAQEKLTPDLYDADKLLKNLIDIVPFGLSSTLPTKNTGQLRKRFNLKAEDKVVLWGGGIWNWFDPLSLIRAIKILSKTRSDIKLVFMGVKHPNDKVPEMNMASLALNLAKELDLYEKHVFFNFGWLPYSERESFLLEADVGASIHAQHLETRYAFRTRILDNIWSCLPVIATEGDSFAELIAEKNLGIVVPYGSSEAIAEAIVRIVDNRETAKEMKHNLEKLRPEFYWERVVQPIETMISQLAKEKAKAMNIKSFSAILHYYYVLYGPVAIAKALMARYVLRPIRDTIK